MALISTGKPTIRREIGQRHPGVVATSLVGYRVPWSKRLLSRREPLATLCDLVAAPILVCRGSHPYRRILPPVSESEAGLAATELAIDLARRLSAYITAISVKLPGYIAGDSARSAASGIESARRLCSLYEVPLTIKEVEGNPVRAVVREASGYDLVVVARQRGRRSTFWNVDVASHLARLSPCSVMVLSIPAGE